MSADPVTRSRRLVLIGAGHTHLHVLRMWRRRPIDGWELTVISATDRAAYSGMLPGTIAGLYRPEQMQIELRTLAARCHARLIVDKAIGFDPESLTVDLAEQPPVEFDVASIGIGSVPGQSELWRNRKNVLGIKPMVSFLDRFNERLEAWQRNGKRKGKGTVAAIRIAIVGAGAAGVEIALCLDAALRRQGIAAAVCLIDANDEILSGYQATTVRLAHRELERRGIRIGTGKRIVNIADNDTPELRFADESILTVDVVIWATGAAPSPVLGNFRLPKTDDGFLAVQATLQTTADRPVFIVGDTAGFVDRRVPKAGVYAVREGPILWRNLCHLLSDQPLQPYEPQPNFLSLLATGDGRAILEYKGFSFHSRWAWWLKDWIDRRFVAMFQTKHVRSDRRSEPGQRAGSA